MLDINMPHIHGWIFGSVLIMLPQLYSLKDFKDDEETNNGV
jgi:hypothetical protein